MATFNRQQSISESFKRIDRKLNALQRRVVNTNTTGLTKGTSAAQLIPPMATNTAAVTAQTVLFYRFVSNQAMTVSTLRPFVSVAGSATNSTFRVGLYDAEGDKIGDSADIVTATNSTRLLSLTLTTPVDIDYGTAYYTAFLMKATSGTPQYACHTQPGPFFNIGLNYSGASGGTADFMNQTGRTSLPSDMTGASPATATNPSSNVPCLLLCE